MPPAAWYASEVRLLPPARGASDTVLGLATTSCVADTPVQGPSGRVSGAGYLQEISPARQTPPVRSQSACALVAGDADGLLPADSPLWTDEHPIAVRAPSTTAEMNQLFI